CDSFLLSVLVLFKCSFHCVDDSLSLHDALPIFLEYERSFEEEEILKYAKTELAVTVFHCLESFLRLYMAHCSMRGCPWLDLADMTLTKYNNNIQKLKKQVYNIFNLSDFTDDEIITAVFYGSKSVPAEIIDKTNLT